MLRPRWCSRSVQSAFTTRSWAFATKYPDAMPVCVCVCSCGVCSMLRRCAVSLSLDVAPMVRRCAVSMPLSNKGPKTSVLTRCLCVCVCVRVVSVRCCADAPCRCRLMLRRWCAAVLCRCSCQIMPKVRRKHQLRVSTSRLPFITTTNNLPRSGSLNLGFTTDSIYFLSTPLSFVTFHYSIVTHGLAYEHCHTVGASGWPSVLCLCSPSAGTLATQRTPTSFSNQYQ